MGLKPSRLGQELVWVLLRAPPPVLASGHGTSSGDSQHATALLHGTAQPGCTGEHWKGEGSPSASAPVAQHLDNFHAAGKEGCPQEDTSHHRALWEVRKDLLLPPSRVGCMQQQYPCHDSLPLACPNRERRGICASSSTSSAAAHSACEMHEQKHSGGSRTALRLLKAVQEFPKPSGEGLGTGQAAGGHQPPPWLQEASEVHEGSSTPGASREVRNGSTTLQPLSKLLGEQQGKPAGTPVRGLSVI